MAFRGKARRVFSAGLLSALALLSSAYVQSQTLSAIARESKWTIPSSDAISKLLAERMEHNGVGIVVGVIEPEGTRVIAYGKSGARNRRPIDGDTVFQIGSVTKTFTTLLLADMVQRGEVMLDDPASKYAPVGVQMPRYAGSGTDRPITLFDLATHRSGLPSMPTNFVLRARPNPIAAYTVAELHAFLSSYTLKRAAGEKAAYSNLGVALLGRLLAAHDDMEYEALLTERVLQPLGMSSTAVTPTREQMARLAPGHDRYLRPVESWEMRALPGSGSLRSTANDLLLYLAAHLGYRDTPLKVAMELQRTAHPDGDPSQRLGWGNGNVGGQEIFMHDGGKAGYRSAVAFNMKARTGVVVLANARTDDPPRRLALYLLAGRPLEAANPAPQQAIAKLDRRLLDRYAGVYRLSAGWSLTVIRRGDHLLVDDAEGGAEYFPSSATDFFLNTDKGDIVFQAGAHGSVPALRFYAGGKESGKYETALRADVAQGSIQPVLSER